jgi:pyrroline-5-carboxylate reductase
MIKMCFFHFSFFDLQGFGAEAVTENLSVVKKSDVVFISVKPNVVSVVLNDVKAISSGKLFISIAMGITLKEIEKELPKDARVIRVSTSVLHCLIG